jgi:hypothetical protein
MKYLVFIIALLFAACDSGSSEPDTITSDAIASEVAPGDTSEVIEAAAITPDASSSDVAPGE